MRIVVTGSLAYDYIMDFPGYFKDHILADKAHILTVSFLVDSMRRMRGGVAGNIAYNLALLGERPVVVSAAGQDFGEYKKFMEQLGIDAKGVREVPNEFTASCFINTDQVNNQIVAFYPGAVGHAKEVTLDSMGLTRDDWVVISPTDPESMAKHTAECKRLGARYVFDPGKQTPRLDRAQILTGLDGAAAFVGNDYELGMMSKATGWSEQQLLDAAPISVITLGERGSRIHVRGQKPIEIPVAKISGVVDPTGCGDAYLSGLTCGLSRGWPMETTGRVAALVAAYCIEHKGCQEHRFDKAAFKRRYADAFGKDPLVETL